MKKTSILILAGEASGDHHASALVRDVREIRPDVEFCGIGGDLLAGAGMKLLLHYRDINTIGLSEGFGKVKKIWAAYKMIQRELKSGKYAMFIPVDFPDVNIRLCLFAKRAKVPVFYYISPQIWAWRKGRLKIIAARIDKMMTLFPFEEKLYRSAGVDASFVGHTMMRDLPESLEKATFRRNMGLDPSLFTVALVPGSRQAEVRRMLPVMCEAALLHTKHFPETQFVLPLAGAHLLNLVQEITGDYPSLNIQIQENASDVMAASDAGLVTSGTATLQAALMGMPHAVVYSLDKYSWFVALHILKPLLMDKDIHVAISNVLAIHAEDDPGGPLAQLSQRGVEIPCNECGRPLFVPEILQELVTPANLAEWLLRFRTDANLLAALNQGFAWLRKSLAAPREKQAAELVIKGLEESRDAVG